jgi:hypothetical protein
MKSRRRLVFPLLLLVLTLALVFFMVFNWRFKGQAESNVPETEMVTEDGYRAQVKGIMDTYFSDQQAEAASDALLRLSVPGTMRDLHLSLAMALSQIVSGQENGADRLEKIIEENPWLR